MKSNSLTARLRHHVTGAIERGEGTAIAGIPALNTSALRFDGCGINDGNGERFATIPRCFYDGERWNDARAFGEKIAKRYNAHTDLVSTLQALVTEFDKYDNAMAQIGRGHEDYGMQRENARRLLASLA